MFGRKADRALIEGAHGVHAPIADMLARATAAAQHDEVPKPAPFMVPHVQGLIDKTLTRLRHDEHDLEAQLADISERLRQTKVAIEALASANDVLVGDMKETSLVNAMQARTTSEDTVEAATQQAIKEFEQELEHTTL